MSAWRDCVTVALLGTEKGSDLCLPEGLETALATAPAMEREARFLTRAGALALWRRAGWNPPESQAELSKADVETTRPISAASAGHLHLMLNGRFAGVLPEWLDEVSRVGRHVFPEFLPALLDRSRQDRGLRLLAMSAGGRRANWLAMHHADWAFAAADSPALWETGSRDQRAGILRALRKTEPAEARLKVEAVWKEEAADVRAAFLAEFAANLSSEDAPFLEAALDDRSKEVRRVAVELLSRLPESSYVTRMLERAKPLLTWKPGRLLGKGSLEAALPAEPDAAGVRDGLDPKAFGAQKKLGDRAVLLAQILAAVPLRHWTESFSQTPDALIEAAKKSEFGRAIATGLAWAAVRQRNAAWAEALLDGPVQPHLEFVAGGNLLAVLPEDARAVRLVEVIRAGALKKSEFAEWQTVLGQLNGFSEGWPIALGRAVLTAVGEACEAGLPYHLRSVAESMMLRLPEALLPDAIRFLPKEHESVAVLVELLSFRSEALAALREP